MGYLILGVLIIIVGIAISSSISPDKLNANKESVKEQAKVRPAKGRKDAYFDLRNMALEMTADKIGLAYDPGELKVYGIIMDWNVGKTTVSLSSFASGDASMYLSTGGGILGGGGHQNVRIAVFKYLKVGQGFLEKAMSVVETPIPSNGEVYFYFLTPNGKYLGSSDMVELENGTSEWRLLFEEANRVISALRVIS